MDLKKLLFFNKKDKKKRIIILGKTFLSDAIAYYLNKKKIDFTFIKLYFVDDFFFENIFIPETIASKLDLAGEYKDIKFTFYDNGLLLPVINNYDLFKECYLCLTGNNSDIKLFEEFLEKNFLYNYGSIDYFKKEFSEIFYRIILSILNFYNYPDVSQLKLVEIKNILNDFFSKNLCYNQNSLSEIFNEKNKNIQTISITEKDYLNKKNSAIIIKNQIITFDVLFTDIPDFVDSKKRVIYKENFIEFKIKKDYTTEYFPENLIYLSNMPENIAILHLKREDDNYRYFTLRNETSVSNIYKFFKQYFPELRENDLIMEEQNILTYKNFFYRKETFPFNFNSKITEMIDFIDKKLIEN